MPRGSETRGAHLQDRRLHFFCLRRGSLLVRSLRISGVATLGRSEKMCKATWLETFVSGRGSQSGRDPRVKYTSCQQGFTSSARSPGRGTLRRDGTRDVELRSMYQLSKTKGSAAAKKGPDFWSQRSQVLPSNIRPRSPAALRASARLSASSLCTHSHVCNIS